MRTLAAGRLRLGLAVAALAGCQAYDHDWYGELAAPTDASRDVADAAADADAATGAPDAACRDNPDHPPAAYCDALPALSAAPTIDGVLECGLALERVPLLAWSGVAAAVPPAVSLDVAAAWRPDGLYVFVSVHGAGQYPPRDQTNVFCGDAVEIYLDTDGRYTHPAQYDDPGTRHFTIGAPDSANQPRTDAVYVGETGSGYTVWGSRNFGAFPQPDGYVVEAFFTLDDFRTGAEDPAWPPVAGGHVGLDVQLTIGQAPSAVPDAGSCSGRAGSFVWRTLAADGGCVSPACTTAAFCNPLLAAE